MHGEICVVCGDKQMLFSTVYRWFTKFSSNQESVKDAPYSERTRSAVTKSNINNIKSIIEKDARFTVRQLAQMTNGFIISISSWRKFLRLQRYVIAGSPICSPTSRNVWCICKWHSNCWRSPQKYQKKVFDSLITGDETWVYFYEPKWKVDSRIWAL